MKRIYRHLRRYPVPDGSDGSVKDGHDILEIFSEAQGKGREWFADLTQPVRTGKRENAKRGPASIKPHVINMIRILDAEGLSMREIAKRCRVHRDTVSRYLGPRSRASGVRKSHALRRRGAPSEKEMFKAWKKACSELTFDQVVMLAWKMQRKRFEVNRHRSDGREPSPE